MPDQRPAIVGNWTKIPGPPCSAEYPETLRFQDDGLYFGQPNESGSFTQWDVGTYDVTSHDQISISVANDEIISYTFEATGDRLIFTDRLGCRFEYRRQPMTPL